MISTEQILTLANGHTGDPGPGPSVVELAAIEAPDMVWGFEATAFSFVLRNLGLEELADPAQMGRVVVTVDVHDGQGRFLRRLATRALREPIPVGVSAEYQETVDVKVFAGDYELRCGLLRAVQAEGADTRLESLPIATRALPITVKNTIFEMFVELVNACNFRCSFCPQGELVRPQQPMDFDLATKIVRDLADMGHHHPIRCHLLGEPLLYKRYFDFVDMAHDHGQSVILATNGSRFSAANIEEIFRSKLDELLISLNTPEETLYNEQRGTNVPYSEYIAGITAMVTELVRRGALPKTRINVLYDLKRSNDPLELERLRRIVREWLTVVRDAGAEVPAPEEIVGLDRLNTTVVSLRPGLELQFTPYHEWGEGTPGGPHFCAMPWRQLGIFVDGQATACCVDAQGEINLGNARVQTVAEIWNNSRLNRLREGFLRGIAVDPRCQRCNVRHDREEYFPRPA